MQTTVSAPSLTSADLKAHLHDIQDNVVAPILMRYGRHIFLKFIDGAKARQWLRSMVKRVNAQQPEHGTRFTVNVGFTYDFNQRNASAIKIKRRIFQVNLMQAFTRVLLHMYPVQPDVLFYIHYFNSNKS